MTTVTELDPDGKMGALTPADRESPRPMRSLVAAAARMTGKKIKGLGRSGKSEAWQEDAWDMYDLVGEERFLASTLANRLAQARFYVGKIPQNPTEELEAVTEGPAYEAFDTMVGRGGHFAQLIQRLGVNLFIPGDGYLVGLPKEEPVKDTRTEGLSPFGAPVDDEENPMSGIDIAELKWQMYSVSELNFEDGGGVTLKGFRDGIETSKTWNADDIVLIRVWRPHPRRWWQADSPTRSSLPVLRELVGLTMKISANIDSRLAGAGVFLIPSSADDAVRAAAGATGEDDLSPFAEALMDAMLAPITDRSNASSVVPLMPVVPDDTIEKFRYISFASPADAEDRALRDEAIRRLALGQDCPPELLLGVSGMNHWGAWLVREDVVTTHLEPPLALICDALTTQFLWPVLQEQGVEDYESYVIWFDVDHLIMRPNRSADAVAVHAAGALSDESLRDANGFDESDAPPADPRDDITKLILDMIREAPSLMQNPGLEVVAAQIRAMVEGNTIPETPQNELVEEEAESPEEEADTPPAGDTVPATEDQPAVVAGAGVARCNRLETHAPHVWFLSSEGAQITHSCDGGIRL